jgi:hypothetical protein
MKDSRILLKKRDRHPAYRVYALFMPIPLLKCLFFSFHGQIANPIIFCMEILKRSRYLQMEKGF